MFIKSIVLAAAMFVLVSSVAWAETAVTVEVTDGHALMEPGVTTVDMIVPPRPEEAAELNVGDFVFFMIMPHLEGVGTITNVYDTQDETINRAIILDNIIR